MTPAPRRPDGDHDDLIPHAMGKELTGAIAGARLVTVDGGQHDDLFSQRPDLFDLIAEHALGGRVTAPAGTHGARGGPERSPR